MSLAVRLDSPLHSALSGATSGSAATTTDVPGKYDVAIAGHGYMLDMEADLQGFRGEHFARSSVPILRAQADTADTPAEQSINRESAWRKSQESWHHGAGQVYFDRNDSDPYRFHTSKGVDVWSKWNVSLLNDTSRIRASANTNLRLTSAGTHMYLADGNSLLFTTDMAAFTAVTGTPASACNWVTSDGYNIYAAYGTAVYSAIRGGAAASSFSTGFPATVNIVGYLKGRLMVGAGPSLYNVVTSGAAPAALMTHANSDFTWVGFADGPGFIYAAGYSGSRSFIYKVTILPDASALNAPSVAGELPIGETVRSVKGYLGFLIVGTDRGFRLASPDSSGNLTFGQLIKTPSPVLNFEPADRFVWYGLSNYDGTSTGLGRMDLSVFTSTLTPAYASDLMVTGQGAVTSVSSSSGGLRVFAVSGLGFYLEDSAHLVASGQFTTGQITYGVADDKVAMYLDLRHKPLAGQVTVDMLANSLTSLTLGSSTDPNTTASRYALNAQQTRAETFELTVTLFRDTGVFGPTVTRTTLRAYPAPSRSFKYVVPLRLHNTVSDLNDVETPVDVEMERAFLEGLVASQELITYQEGSLAYSVVVEDCDWIPVKSSRSGRDYGFEGTFVVTLKEQKQ